MFIRLAVFTSHI